MGDTDETTGTRPPGMVLLGLLVLLLVTSAVPGYAGRSGHGGGHGGHGPHGFGHGPQGFGHGPQGFGHGPHRFFGPRLGVSIWPYWTPYWDPYGAPPVVVAPPPHISVQPAPPLWYYCDNPQGYYPYVQQCPGGWQPVTPTPP